ncbi:hypothetical protein J6590_011916 [Homalodisca vitripennis]|nr:hypothetical protein J6590_011916 [Homalodisca vitripennis]
MFRSPQQLRSGRKAQDRPFPIYTEVVCSCRATKMPTDVEACADAYLSEEAFIKELVDGLCEAMNPMIAEAVHLRWKIK